MEDVSLPAAVMDDAEGPAENEKAGVEDAKADAEEEGAACEVPLAVVEAEGCDPNAKPEKDDFGYADSRISQDRRPSRRERPYRT